MGFWWLGLREKEIETAVERVAEAKVRKMEKTGLSGPIFYKLKV